MREMPKMIFPESTSFRLGEFKNDNSMVEKLPPALKKRILDYLKEPEPGLIGDMPMIDPVTGIRYDSTNIIREKDGFGWSSAAIYMLENYDIRLSDEFLKLFEEK